MELNNVLQSNVVQEINGTNANGFTKLADHAQYKGSDYSNAIRVERGITLEEAKEIAANDPEIGYFVFTKGFSMVLEIPYDVEFNPENDPLGLVTQDNFMFDNGQSDHGNIRVFHQGDVVFFKNEGKWLGTAPGLADVYTKN